MKSALNVGYWINFKDIRDIKDIKDLKDKKGLKRKTYIRRIEKINF